MVGYAYYCIEWISPYALLGMVHVLEGLSVMLAHSVAGAVRNSLGAEAATGFSYLQSHGSLDVEHTALFRKLVDSFEDRETQDVIIERGARDVPALWRDLRGFGRTVLGEGLACSLREEKHS